MMARAVPERVLMLSANMGEGHNAAAAALTEVIHEVWPDCEVERIDTVELSGARRARIARWSYSAILRWFPAGYHLIYKALCGSRLVADPLKKASGVFIGRRLESLIAEHDADLIISTYPFGSAGLDWLRSARGMATPTVTFIPAFHVHPAWTYTNVDLHFVMYETAASDALTPGIESQMVLGSPPVRRRFGHVTRDEGREKAGLDPERFTVLVTGGAWGLGSQEHAVRALVGIDEDIQIVTVCGHNEELRERLGALGAPPERLMALGYVDIMPELMAAADVIVTNGAGVTVLEALRTARPVVAFEPLAGHGIAATAVMEKRGLGLSCKGAESFVETIRRLMNDATLMARLQQAGKEFNHGKDLRNDVERMGELVADASGRARDVG